MVSRGFIGGRLGKWAVAVFSLLAAWGVFDVTFSRLFPAGISDRSEYYSPDPYFGWTYAKSAKLKSENAFGEKVSFEFTPEGFRDWYLGAAPAREIRILYVGDSTTGAIQVNRRDHFIQLVDDELSRKGHSTRGFNYGVNGYSADQVLMVLARYVKKIRPALVVYTFVENDIWPISLDRLKIENRLYGKPTVHVGEGGTFIVSPPPFSKIELPVPLKEALIQNSFALPRVRSLVRGWRPRGGDRGISDFQKMNPILGLEEIIRRTRKGNGYPPAVWRALERIVVAMYKVSREADAEFLLFPLLDPWVTLPAARKVLKEAGSDPDSIQRRVLAIARKNGIQATFDVLESFPKPGPLSKHLESLYFAKNGHIYDEHFSVHGHRMIAGYLAPWIERMVAK